MAGSLIYVDESLYSPDSEPANGGESSNDGIHEGDVVTRESGGGAHVTNPSNDSRVDGIVPHLDRGDHLPEHDEDFSTPVYEGDGSWSGSDTVTFSVYEDGAVWYPWTVKDDSLSAPSIGKNDVVGVIMPNNEPVVVEDGYSDGSGNTYTAGDNLIVLGFADAPSSDYGETVPVRLDNRA